MRPRAPAPAPPRTLCPADLVAAPELASLAIVEQALHAALLSLVAAHPTLEDFAQPREPPSLRLARRLVSVSAAVHRALGRYRVAVYDALQPPPVSDDTLF